jgi:hypothetical protein
MNKSKQIATHGVAGYPLRFADLPAPYRAKGDEHLSASDAEMDAEICVVDSVRPGIPSLLEARIVLNALVYQQTKCTPILQLALFQHIGPRFQGSPNVSPSYKA